MIFDDFFNHYDDCFLSSPARASLLTRLALISHKPWTDRDTEPVKTPLDAGDSVEVLRFARQQLAKGGSWWLFTNVDFYISQLARLALFHVPRFTFSSCAMRAAITARNPIKLRKICCTFVFEISIFVHLPYWFFGNFQWKSQNLFHASRLAFPIRFLRFANCRNTQNKILSKNRIGL